MQVILEDHFWEGDDEVVLTTWYVDEGDHVQAGDIIAEVMLAKTQMEIEAPVSGTLRSPVPLETAVRKGQAIAVIEEG